MLRMGGQTAGPIGLNFFWTLMGARGVLQAISKSNFFFNFLKTFLSRITPGPLASDV